MGGAKVVWRCEGRVYWWKLLGFSDILASDWVLLVCSIHLSIGTNTFSIKSICMYIGGEGGWMVQGLEGRILVGYTSILVSKVAACPPPLPHPFYLHLSFYLSIYHVTIYQSFPVYLGRNLLAFLQFSPKIHLMRIIVVPFTSFICNFHVTKKQYTHKTSNPRLFPDKQEDSWEDLYFRMYIYCDYFKSLHEKLILKSQNFV